MYTFLVTTTNIGLVGVNKGSYRKTRKCVAIRDVLGHEKQLPLEKKQCCPLEVFWARKQLILENRCTCAKKTCNLHILLVAHLPPHTIPHPSPIPSPGSEGQTPNTNIPSHKLIIDFQTRWKFAVDIIASCFFS